MMDEITRLDDPIDVMFLMHKAFHEISMRAERLAAEGQRGGDLTEFRKTFDLWVKQFLYHADTEDRYMTGPMAGSQAAQDNEAEHSSLKQHCSGLYEFLGQRDSAGLEDHVTAAILALEEVRHQELLAKVGHIQDILQQEMGQEKVVARARRHLYRQVIATRVLEFDHFENEEAFVCSLVRDQMSEKEQLNLVRRLLIDEAADDPRWVIDWVARELGSHERKLLAGLEARFS